MTCSEAQRILPEILDGTTDVQFQAHVESCPECSELVSDLALIASTARQLADTEEPSARVWANIANQLRAEGVIREPQTTHRRWRLPTSPQDNSANTPTGNSASRSAAGSTSATTSSGPTRNRGILSKRGQEWCNCGDRPPPQSNRVSGQLGAACRRESSRAS